MYILRLSIQVSALSFFFLVLSCKESEYRMPSLTGEESYRMVPESVAFDNAEEKLNTSLQKLERELREAKSKVDALSTENDSLMNELNDLIYAYDEMKRNGKGLQDSLVNFTELNENEKQKLLDRIFTYLSPESNPKIDRSIGLIITEKVNLENQRQKNNEISDLKLEIQQLKQENFRLRNTISKLNMEKRNLENNYELIQELLRIANEQVVAMEEELSKVNVKLSESDQRVHDISREQKGMQSSMDSLVAVRDSLNNALKKVIPFSLIRFDVVPKNSRSFKDGTYKAKRIRDGFRISLKMRKTKPLSENGSEFRLVCRLRVLNNNKEPDLEEITKSLYLEEGLLKQLSVGEALRYDQGKCYFQLYYGEVLVGNKVLSISK